MIFDNMYTQSNILNAALNASAARNEVILSNIANNDTPGYKSKTVDFEDALIAALERRDQTGVLDLSDVKPSIRFSNENFNYRIDENNVDIEMEMVSLYQNSVRYETMINCVLSNSKSMSLALTGR